jgi:hemerythrin superfamily protein
MTDDDVYLSPAQIDEAWDLLKQEQPDAPREAAVKFMKLLAKHNAQEEARIHRFVEHLKPIMRYVDAPWLIELGEIANIDAKDLSEVLGDILKAPTTKQ